MRRSIAPSAIETAKQQKINRILNDTSSEHLHCPKRYQENVRIFRVDWLDEHSEGEEWQKGTVERYDLLDKSVLKNTNGIVIASALGPLESVEQFRIGNKIINVLTELHYHEVKRQQARQSELNNEDESNRTSTWSSDKLFFKMVWRESSTKKHKTWKGDGTVEVQLVQKRIILKDHTGKYLGSDKMPTIGVMEEGMEISVGNKEIELLEQIKDQDEYWAIRRQEVEERGWETDITSSSNMKEQSKSKRSLFFRPILHIAPLQMPKKCNKLPKKLDDSFILEPVENSQQFEKMCVSSHLTKHLRAHQREGVTFIYSCLMGFRQPNCYGCILADEMGLGKTLQCLTVAQTLLRHKAIGVQRVLIVTPSSLVANWDNEINKWLRDDRLFAFVVGGGRQLASYLRQQHIPFVIVSYESLSSHIDEFKDMRFDLLICDEGHRLKNQTTKIFSNLNDLNIRRRLILTGTPIQNDLNEFFALADFVNPGVLGSLQDFRKYYERPIMEGRNLEAPESVNDLATKRTAELSTLCAQFLLRRTQKVIREYLPKKREYICFVKPTELQLLMLQYALSLYEERQKTILEELSPLQLITTLKKICNHPSLIAHIAKPNTFTRLLERQLPSWSQMGPFDSAKLEVVQHLLTATAVARRNKCVLVSSHMKTLNMLQDLCEFLQLKCLRIDGSTPLSERQINVETFNGDDDDDGETALIFLLSTKAGGAGLNLIGASILILFDQDWNPAIDAQAVARIWRDGQKRDVKIYRLITAGCIEEKIFQRQIAKLGLSGDVFGVDKEAAVKFTAEQLFDLFTIQTDFETCETHSHLNCSCSGDGLNTKTCDDSALMKGLNELKQWQHFGAPFGETFLQNAQLTTSGNSLLYVFMNQTDKID